MSSSVSFSWPVAEPFIQRRMATAEDIDEFGHVNNQRYIAWAMDVAWVHSGVLGFTMDDYKRIGVGCVVWRHEFDYKAAIMAGEEVLIATWIAESDGRLRLTRAFEMRNAATGAVCFSGRTLFVTIDIKTGKPQRMPPDFVRAYRPAS